MTEKTIHHTPGPWGFDRKITYVNSPGEQEQHGSLEIFSCNNEILIADVNDYFDKNIGEANAYLIAAAPDLLDACEEFVRKCECGEAKSRRSYAQMKAAIAKAKGECS